MTAAAPDIATDLAKSVPLTAHGGIDWWQVLQNWAAAIAILLIGWWLAKWIARAIRRVNTRARMDATLNGFLSNLAYAVALMIVAIAALDKLGVPIASAVTILGTVGLAVGLALKDSLSNIASGVMLIVLRPFHVGDTVIVAGLEGIVEEVCIFQTRLRTADNRVIVLPNSSITTTAITNLTSRPQRRIDITVGVGYGDDLRQAQRVLLKIAQDNALVLEQPAPLVQVAGLGDSAVNLTLFAWADTGDAGTAKSQLLESIRDDIIASGLSLPYPQRDLHVYHHDADGRSLAEVLARPVGDGGEPPQPSAKSDT